MQLYNIFKVALFISSTCLCTQDEDYIKSELDRIACYFIKDGYGNRNMNRC